MWPRITRSFAQTYAASGSVASAFVRQPAGIVVQSFRAIKDVDTDAARTVHEVLVASSDSLSLVARNPLQSQPAALSVSPSGLRTLSAAMDADEKPILLLDDRESGVQLKVDASAFHAELLSATFGGISWSSCERFVAYSAAPKKEKKTSVFDAARNENEAAPTMFDYVDDWGEKLVGISESVICILDCSAGQICLLPGIDDAVTVGQPAWKPSKDGTHRLVYVAWRTLPRRLGALYCHQRPTELFQCDISELVNTLAQGSGGNDQEHQPQVSVTHESLTKSLPIAHSPRWSPSGEKLVFLGRTTPLVTHDGCVALMRWDGERTSVVVDVVEKPLTGGFPGLFPASVPASPFVDENTVVINTAWRSKQTIAKIDVTDGSVADLAAECDSILGILGLEEAGGWNNPALASCSALDVSDGMVLFSASAPNAPEQIGLFVSEDQKVLAAAAQAPFLQSISTKASLASMDDAPEVVAQIRALQWKVLTLSQGGIEFEAILLLPPHADASRKCRLIVSIHGGPHACSPAAFAPNLAFLSTHLNAAVVQVNYRGSTGFGQASIDSLPGNIGTNDVADVMACVDAAVDTGVVDATRIAVIGGSHGGFLTAHLIGQHPEKFKAAAMRNPVTDIPSMHAVTDIPDWCFVEAIGPSAYDFDTYRAVTEKQLLQMKQCSPVAHVDAVKTPTLIALGEGDLRVPFSQGLHYHHLLRSKGVETKLMTFPKDSHPLDRPLSDATHWTAVAHWVERHMPGPRSSVL